MTDPSALPRLCTATLGQARSGTILPSYDRQAIETGIVHLGLGAFVRGHLAIYTDDVLAIESGPWGIAGVSLKRPDQRDRLQPQDGLYTTLQRAGGGVRARLVGCLRQATVAPEDPAALLRAMAAPSCRIVSLTITEKGYCHDPATGSLDPDHPDIAHDREHPDRPRSAVGLIAAALRGRHAAGSAPFTVLSCDNLPQNGALLSGLVRDFAAFGDDRLAAWIETSGAFPSTMVDRIVPALVEADVQDAADATGLYDAAPVSHEPFRQWVIEDRFAGTRPAWEKVGAQLVSNVASYEHMKLRLLNGAHSALAYLGYLAGYETIPDVIADPTFRTYVRALWDEVIPVVPQPPGTDLHEYTAELQARFGNTSIRHRTWQIAMDGSQKLPQRLLSTVRDRLARGQASPAIALAVAAWVRFVGGQDERGLPIDVRDPLAETLQATLRGAGPDPARRVRAIFAVAAVFGTDLPRAQSFVGDVSDRYAQLCTSGASSAVARFPTSEA